VSPEEHGRRIEAVLERRTGEHRDRVARLLRRGLVVDGGSGLPLHRGQRVEHGDLVEVREPDPTPRGAPVPNRKVKLRVLHADPDVAAVFKPAGVVMHPGPGHGTDTLQNALVARFPSLLDLGPEREYGLVHRLDRDTSGVVLVGLTPAGYGGLVEAFEARAVRKTYLALVHERAPLEDEGRCELPVAGKDAITTWEVTERRGPVARVVVRPLTGRTHQVRVHLAAQGAPVLADSRHGHGLDALTARLFLTRLALHAARVEAVHPVSGQALAVEVDWPKDLRRAWRRAERPQPQ